MSQRTLFEEPNGVEAPPAIAADALQPWDVDDRQNVIHPTAVTYCRPLPFPKPVGAMGRTFRTRVLAFIQQQGRKGATVADVAAGMGIDVPTARIAQGIAPGRAGHQGRPPRGRERDAGHRLDRGRG